VIDAQRVDYIRVPVTDMETANHFYGEVLGLERSSNSPIALRVRDVPAAKAKLESAGIQVGDLWDSGVCQGAGVSDPAGNRILLHHRYAPYPDGTTP
jgi:predicted enzyme related to lactoylglutathione lyase